MVLGLSAFAWLLGFWYSVDALDPDYGGLRALDAVGAVLCYSACLALAYAASLG